MVRLQSIKYDAMFSSNNYTESQNVEIDVDDDDFKCWKLVLPSLIALPHIVPLLYRDVGMV